MTEETDAPQGGAEDVTTSLDTVEETSDATTEQPTAAEEAGQADDTGEATEEPQKRVPWFQKRIDEVTAQKYEERRRADYLQGQLDALMKGNQPQTQQQAPPDRWEDPEGYDQWLIEQATARATQQFEQRQQQQSTLRSYEERVSAVRQSKPDFDSVVGNPDLPITNDMAEIIRATADGPEVAYYLGKNPSEAARISRLAPNLQALEMGRIAAGLTKPAPAAQKPIPPTPPQTVGGLSSGLTKSLEDMSFAEFKKLRDAEEANRN